MSDGRDNQCDVMIQKTHSASSYGYQCPTSTFSRHLTLVVPAGFIVFPYRPTELSTSELGPARTTPVTPEYRQPVISRRQCTGSFSETETDVCDLFACVYTRGTLVYSLIRRTFVVCTEFDSVRA